MMHFLLQNNKRQIASEYLLRIFIFAFIFISAASCVLIALFLPSFFFSEYKNKNIADQAQSINFSNSSNYDSLLSQIKNINGMASALSYGTVSPTFATDIIDMIISLKNKNITIAAISISPDPNTNAEDISVSGVSATRDDLTSFDTVLKGEATFQNVVLPVSTLINNSAEPFTITFSYAIH